MDLVDFMNSLYRKTHNKPKKDIFKQSELPQINDYFLTFSMNFLILFQNRFENQNHKIRAILKNLGST